jgi:putative phage-type endonuclease
MNITNRKMHNLIQGSDAWHKYRATPKQFNASDAPAMLGESPYKSRDQLLKEIATGSFEEIDPSKQKLFDDGHRFEAEDRPLAEEYIGQELFACTMSVDVDGFKLSASLDGQTMDEEIIYEHKTLNKSIEAAAKLGEIPLVYQIQMEHQLIVSGAEWCLFSASKGTDSTLKPIRIEYRSNPELREKIFSGWVQFAIDLDNYKGAENLQSKPIAELVETLPALTYKTSTTEKGLTLVSNIDEYKAACVALVERSKQKMETDQDFANAENRVKLCKEAEEKISHMQKQVLGEVVDIDKFSRDLEAIASMLRECRLNEDKQVKQRKDQIRFEIIDSAKAALVAHVKTANEAIAALGHGFRQITMPLIAADFAGAIKGKKTIKSLQESANDELARAKIEANRVLSIIDANLAMLKVAAKDYSFLFSDIQSLIAKDAEDLKAIAINRIAEHKNQEQAKIDAEAARVANEAVEAERKRVADASASIASPVSRQPVKEEQAPLFGQDFVSDFVSAENEYFGDPITSPVVDEKTGGATVVTKEQIITAVHKYWGITPAEAELACIQAFQPKI